MAFAMLLLASVGGQVPAATSTRIWGGPAGGVPQATYTVQPSRGTASHARILDQTDDSIDAALRDGSLSKSDARGLRNEVRRLRSLSHRYGAGGLSQSESRMLHSLALSLHGLVQSRRSVRSPG